MYYYIKNNSEIKRKNDEINEKRNNKGSNMASSKSTGEKAENIFRFQLGRCVLKNLVTFYKIFQYQIDVIIFFSVVFVGYDHSQFLGNEYCFKQDSFFRQLYNYL